MSAIQGVPSFKVEKPVEAGIATRRENWDAVHLAMKRVVEAGTAGA